MQPFDYVSGFGQNPMGGLMGAMEAGQRFGMMEQQQAAAREKQQMLMQQQQAESLRQQQIREATMALLAKPNRTMADYANLGLWLDKEGAANVRAFGEAWTKEQDAAELKTYLPIFAALNKGKTDVAIRFLRESEEAYRNSGLEQEAKAAANWVRLAEEMPTEVDGILGARLMRTPEGRAAVKEALEQRRQEALSPAAVREAEAKAQEAEIKLKRLDAIQEAELRKARSEAERNEVLARFASRREQAQLDLTNAQAAAQRASANKTEAELQKLKADADNGPIPEFNAQAGGFIVRPSKENPRGGFIPLTTIADEKSQQGAIKALRTAGYDPETGEDDISRLIKQSTGGLLQTASTEALRFLNISTPGRKAIAQLEATANAIVLDMNNGKLGAGISNADREFLVNTLGNIGDPLKPVGERLAAWNSAKNRLITSGMIPPPKSQQKPAENGVDTSNPLLR